MGARQLPARRQAHLANQAVFALAEGRVLVFTTAMARKLTPQDDALLLQVLSSYRAA